jgi:hypothetical protein
VRTSDKGEGDSFSEIASGTTSRGNGIREHDFSASASGKSGRIRRGIYTERLADIERNADEKMAVRSENDGVGVW